MLKDTLTTVLVCVLGVVLLSLFYICVSGCSTKEYYRKEFDTTGNLIAEVWITSKDRIIKTKIEDMLVIVNGNNRLIYIGDLDQSPDPNAIKSIATGVVGGIGTVIKGGI